MSWMRSRRAARRSLEIMACAAAMSSAEALAQAPSNRVAINFVPTHTGVIDTASDGHFTDKGERGFTADLGYGRLAARWLELGVRLSFNKAYTDSASMLRPEILFRLFYPAAHAALEVGADVHAGLSFSWLP